MPFEWTHEPRPRNPWVFEPVCVWALLMGLCLFLAERVWTVTRYQGELLAAAQERALDLALRGQAAFDQDVASAKMTLSMLAERETELFNQPACDALLASTLAAAANILHLTVTNTDGRGNLLHPRAERR